MLRSILAFAAVLIGQQIGLSRDGDLVEYFSGWKGQWIVSENQERGFLTISADPDASCIRVKGRIGNNGFDEIAGYDAVAKHWTVVGYGLDGESYKHAIRNFPKHKRPKANDSWSAKSTGVMPDGTPTSADLKWTVVNPRSKVVLEISNAKEGEKNLPARQIEYTRVDYVEFWMPLQGNWKSTTKVGGETFEGTFSYQLTSSGTAFISSNTKNGEPASSGINAFDPLRQAWFGVSIGADGSKATSHVHVDNAAEVFPLSTGTRGSYETVLIDADGSQSISQGDFVWREFADGKGTLVLLNNTKNGVPQDDVEHTYRRMD